MLSHRLLLALLIVTMTSISVLASGWWDEDWNGLWNPAHYHYHGHFPWYQYHHFPHDLHHDDYPVHSWGWKWKWN